MPPTMNRIRSHESKPRRPLCRESHAEVVSAPPLYLTSVRLGAFHRLDRSLPGPSRFLRGVRTPFLSLRFIHLLRTLSRGRPLFRHLSPKGRSPSRPLTPMSLFLSRSRILSWSLVLTLMTGGWGCEPPERSPQAGAPDSALIDSARAALDRFHTGRASSADSIALRRSADRLQAAGDSLKLRRPDRARTLLRTALRARRTLSDSARVATTLHGIGRTYSSQSHYEDALPRYRDALSINRELDRPEVVADNLNGIGRALYSQGKYEEAMDSLQQSLALYRDQNNERGIATVYSSIGSAYLNQSRYEKGLDRLNRSLSMHREHGPQRGVARAQARIGAVRQIQGRYEEALAHLRASLSESRRQKDRGLEAAVLSTLGIVRYRQGHYAEALTRFHEALSHYRALSDSRSVARTLNRIGAVYSRQGRYEEALARYREALPINQELEHKDGIAGNLNNIGIILRHQGRWEEALTNFQRALSLNREQGDRRAAAINLSNQGEVLRLQGRDEEALEHYRKALSLNRELGARESMASNFNNIGKVYRRQGRYGDALDHFRKAFSLRRTLESHMRVASLREIGAVHLDRGRVQAAIDTLDRAVRLAETLRLQAASPKDRRSLLSTQIESYRKLTAAYVRYNQPDSALRAAEQARARLLADHLAGTARGDTALTVPSAPALQATLGRNEAALLYTNVGTNLPLTGLAVTRDTAFARELPEAAVRTEVGHRYPDRLKRLRRRENELAEDPRHGGTDSSSAAPRLAEIIHLYHRQLTRPDAPDSVRTDLSRRLHGLLLAPIMADLRDKETLTVVPSGGLGRLPLETLQDANGEYLIERKHVRYVQSLTVLDQLQRRDYASPGRPLLALGGADYGAPPPRAESPILGTTRGDSTTDSPTQASALLRTAERRMERGKTPRPAYARLGYDQWPALYGTKLEVQKLGDVVDERTRILTGEAASEEQVRRLSDSGQLSRYRRLHFATHGIALPEAPGLSALVLSQENASDSLADRDGYLTMQEISDLDLKADVAVLSACRTGRGRTVAGEGIVNLSHAFLQAGANATLVSQWRVLDWSTQQFMTATYRTAERANTSLAKAATRVKREFIDGTFGERNTDPLRWGAFVYYGRE